MDDLIKVDEQQIRRAIARQYQVAPDDVCLYSDYEFVRRGDDKVKRAFVYGIIDKRNRKIITTDDVVEVVRCKNCKHRPISTIEGEDYGFSLEPPDDDWRCPCLNGDDGWYSWMPEDDFYCANGERRTEDG